jgi:predicted nucleic acid-binding protein
MTFADLIAGEAIFLDANPFVYHFVADPQYGAACSQLPRRIENQEITGLTSTHVLTEMAHRIMTVEAIGAFNWPASGIAHRLRQHPAPRCNNSRNSTKPLSESCKAESRS